MIITTYYRNERLRAAIRSALEQTYEPIEVIVVDDSGEWHAEGVVAEFDRVRYLGLDANGGHIQARNRGFAESTGEVIQFLDDDDTLAPSKFEKQVPLLSDTVGVVYCGVRREGNPAIPKRLIPGTELERALANDFRCCITSTMIVDRAILESVTPFPEMPAASDSLMRIEFARVTEFDFVEEVLAEKGYGADPISLTFDKCRGYEFILDRYADLYDACPRWVRRSMLASKHRKSGEIHLHDRWWSASTIVDFGRAAIYDRDPMTFGLSLLAIFGKPGLIVGILLFTALHPDKTVSLPVWVRA